MTINFTFYLYQKPQHPFITSEIDSGKSQNKFSVVSRSQSNFALPLNAKKKNVCKKPAFLLEAFGKLSRKTFKAFLVIDNYC